MEIPRFRLERSKFDWYSSWCNVMLLMVAGGIQSRKILDASLLCGHNQ
jgi:hypothetical protein